MCFRMVKGLTEGLVHTTRLRGLKKPGPVDTQVLPMTPGQG